MSKKLLPLILLTFLTLSSYSQKNADPSGNDKIKAKSLKTEFPDDNVALLESNDYISFDFNKKDQKVMVNHKLDESLINLDSRSDIQKYCFYDGETEITEFIIKYKSNKDTHFYIKDEAFTSNDLFHNDSRVKYVNLDFPVKGYKYLSTITKKYKDIKYFTQLYFNNQYPIEKKSIVVEIPNWLEIELKEINFEGHTIEKNIKNNEKSNSKTYTYTLENLPAMAKEENTPGPTYIYPHLLILAKSYTIKDKKETIFNSTQDLYNWYKSLVNSLENDNTTLKEKVKELIENASTDDEKIKNIYYWVQDNIRYIAFEDGIAGFKPDEASNVFNKKYGDCKGMANLTKQMLIEAGFDARLTWIGTKRIAYDYSTPNLSVDNHMICALLKDGKTIFLDGTEKFNAFGEYADRIQGKQALIENGDDFILKEIPIHNAVFNNEQINYSLAITNEDIIGTADKSFNGESRSSLLYYFHTLKNDKKDEFLESYLNKGNSNIKVSDITTSNLSDRDLNIDISYSIEIKNAISSFDESIYVDLDFDKQFSNYSFDKRKNNFIFSSKKDLESTTKLTIPSGYKVSKLPEDISVSSKNYDMSVKFSKQDNTIIYKKFFKIKNATIETTDFEEWNDFIKRLNSIYNEQIILTKQ